MFTGKNYYLEHGNQGVIIIKGTINGDIVGAEDVIVTSTGTCNCNISAKNLIIDGTVTGNIDVETLVIDAGKLYYDRIKTDQLLISEQGFIAHKSDAKTEKIPENFVIMKIEETTSKYEKVNGKLGVNLRYFKLFTKNSTDNELAIDKHSEVQEQNEVIEEMEPNIVYEKSNDGSFFQEFYSSF
jgi:cytoskeletal protein CcmA (bactofilin family)